ncbi:peptidoglycan recognition family protein [Cytobacillus sp. FSL W7-1323]|uniref:peptidoglycan recognition protein family protein n=1 Tax=unclassified Cytobacillus TaxID=2675268 RepID=UPI002AFF90A5|nr:peptidoglycan recognition family protein [Cytobacillus sp. OWB-43]MEA1855671.1 peptidoglycan recognition family protein [Cytobacillus sp. OWB-43]
MAGLLDIPKFVDFRNEVKRHPRLKFPVLSLKGKTTLAIHHSLTKQGLGGSNAEGYARYHVDTHGWPSIGYSYVIEPDGTIKFCNDIELRTYHVGDHNNYAIGICLTGDFRSEKPTKKQEESLRNLVATLQKNTLILNMLKDTMNSVDMLGKSAQCLITRLFWLINQ